MKTADLTKRIDELLEHGNEVIKTQHNIGAELALRAQTVLAYTSACLRLFEAAYRGKYIKISVRIAHAKNQTKKAVWAQSAHTQTSIFF